MLTFRSYFQRESDVNKEHDSVNVREIVGDSSYEAKPTSMRKEKHGNNIGQVCPRRTKRIQESAASPEG